MIKTAKFDVKNAKSENLKKVKKAKKVKNVKVNKNETKVKNNKSIFTSAPNFLQCSAENHLNIGPRAFSPHLGGVSC